MFEPSYRQRSLIFGCGLGTAREEQVRDVQRDLRRLGYLKEGIDGRFGSQTEQAVRALKYDLMFNDGAGTGEDGSAPIRMVDFNRGRVSSAVHGHVDQPLVECIVELLNHPQVPALPSADQPVEENRKIVRELAALPSGDVPVPFLVAIFQQESSLKHFHEPGPGDEDTFITVGLDRKPGAGQQIVSRGYGVGQYTLFHHPPRGEEVDSFMRLVEENVRQSARELRDKLDHFLLGPAGGARADDRRAEIGSGPLRICRYPLGDDRYLRNCQGCAREAGCFDIHAGQTPLFPGSSQTYVSTLIYPTASYEEVPRRDRLGCDWPYAARRYNGAGIGSFHYQVRILKNLLAGLPSD